MRKFFILLIAITGFTTQRIEAQSITNIRAVQTGDNINIYYDIVDYANGSYNISVYCSEDGGLSWGNPLTQVEGDVNKVVTTGANKKIVWHVLNEKDQLIGNLIQFEIRASKENVANVADVAFTGKVLMDSRDGQSYQVIKVQDTYWMAENLNYNSTGSYCYDNDLENCDKYGRLYTWDEANKNCPAGWKLPDERAWNDLELHLGMPANVLTNLRWRGTNQGEMLKKGGVLGFDALYGGFRTDRGGFDRIGLYSYFWSASEWDGRVSYCRLLLFSHPGIYLNRYNKSMGMSVRCIRN